MNKILKGLSIIIITFLSSCVQNEDTLKTTMARFKNAPSGIGFPYWGEEWFAFRGTLATNGSTFENQALWDFNFNALPIMDAFN